jgi:hypothetical protein
VLGPLPASAIDTSPVGFAVFDRVLVTVHPEDCLVREYFAQRLSQQSRETDLRGSGRLPTSPAEQMLRMVNHMVDSYLELRRVLTRHFAALQAELLRPRSRFAGWHIILQSREALHRLEDTSEDQRSAIQEWIDALDEWPAAENAAGSASASCCGCAQGRAGAHRAGADPCAAAGAGLRGRGADALLGRGPAHQRHHAHADRADGHLPAAEPDHRHLRHELRGLPLIHKQDGFWIAVGVMAATGLGLGGLFWRKRYLGTRQSPD